MERISKLKNHLETPTTSCETRQQQRRQYAGVCGDQSQQSQVSQVSTNEVKGKASNVFQDPNASAVPLNAQELFSLKGKVALVTGGSKGIGRMIAEGFVANGAKVYICSRKAEICEETAQQLNAKYGKGSAASTPGGGDGGGGGSAVALPGDLSTLTGVEAVVESFGKKEDRLHILVNNAGATHGAPFDEYPDSAWERVMNLNVRHVFNLTKLMLPKLQNGQTHADPARVINISSSDGVRAQQTYGPTAAFAYTTSKGAVVHLSSALCRALSPYNVSVNTIAPGVFPSNMTKFFLQDDNLSEKQAKSNPLKRNGRTADMAGTALYLCSAAGSWTNGSVIVVDGGSFLHDTGMFAL